MTKIPQQLNSYIYDELDFTEKMAEKLVLWHDALLKWQPKINLISPKTINDVWERHFMDSLQLAQYLPKQTKELQFADFGSGAGFPGLAIALQVDAIVHLVESDQRKAIFLREVIRLWGDSSRIKVISQRIESLEDASYDYISARALADLNQLLAWACSYLKKDGQCLFLKGKNWKEEILNAQKYWQFDYENYQSITNDEAMVILAKNIKEKNK
ncbi:MAG: 16S rRNA (guanine(527)-N(7))-methyltransferase RsmG [Alphaproteobacteria bacterium]